MKKYLLFLFLVVTVSTFSQGFLHRNGQNIVDGNNKNILLRGLGLGGWMVQEGYMLQAQSFASPQYQIKTRIENLIGPADTEKFYAAYKANGVTKRDIDSLAAWGFNSIRLPMHYNLYTPSIQEEKKGQISWLEEGFVRTDSLLNWCAANKIYLILDLHATPGGQGKDAAISDYDDSKPSLWERAANQDKMIAFWKKLAARYKDNPWIGGYDIINEPNWNFSGTNKNGCDETLNAPLRALMIAVTKAIREVDTHHMIIIEGNCWGNNYNGIFPLWDENITLSFHKYWNYNTQESIQKMLDYRTQYNVPIWLGESGENSNVWFKEAITLVESNAIGWAFWPMKKIENIAGITSVTKNTEYDILLQYWKNGGAKPTAIFAKNALMQLAENYKMDRVAIKYDVIDAMFRQVQTNTTKAYKKHVLPGKISATDYDLGTNTFAYFDTDIANYKVDTGTFEEWNKGKSLRNDGVDILPCADINSNGYQVSFIENGEWLQYTVDLENQNTFDVAIRYSNNNGTAKLYLEMDGGQKTTSIALPQTGSETLWETVVLPSVSLKKGTTKIKVVFEIGGINLSYLEFIKTKN